MFMIFGIYSNKLQAQNEVCYLELANQSLNTFFDAIWHKQLAHDQ
jgi:hypothetical protein